MPGTNPGLLNVEGLLDILEKTDPASEFFRAAAGVLDSHLASGQLPAPPPAPRQGKKLLTIGMATYDDYDGVYFSVQAIRLYHPEVTSETEILVIDNHPGGPCSQALKHLESRVAGYRCIEFGDWSGTAVRDIIFREADSEYVLVIDAHVLFAPGSLSRLIRFLKTQSESKDLWQGPLLYDDLTTLATHYRPEWSAGMYGVWDCDRRGMDPDAPPFEIQMQGLGVFACRKDAWVGFNPRLRGFGGEEGFIHEKVRQNGGKVMCLPFLRWAHRFGRPLGPPYVVSWNDRIRNYLIKHDELNLDPAPAIDHFEKLLGAERARPIVEAAKQEIAGPFHFFDAIYCITWTARRIDGSLSARVSRSWEWRSVCGVFAQLKRPSIITSDAPSRIDRLLNKQKNKVSKTCWCSRMTLCSPRMRSKHWWAAFVN
jgi:Glycosyl transferase family 2